MSFECLKGNISSFHRTSLSPRVHFFYALKIIWEILFCQGKLDDPLQMTKDYNLRLLGTKDRTGSC